MSNYFSQYCSDYYKNGNIFLKNKYKWLCPCSTDPSLYPLIKNDYRREYQITKNILLKEEQLQRIIFIKYVESSVYQTNGSRYLKRRVTNSQINDVYNFINTYSNYK
jgi:hypothetical protein